MHSQGGTHTRVRIPRFGRALGYHFPTCDALVGAAGREIFRLNLDQGRFLAPYVLGGGDERGEVEGCNAVDVNPAHGLLAFGTEGSAGTVELWDPRARTRAGKLSIATRAVVDAALSSARRGLPALSLPQDESGAGAAGLSVTCLASADDGLNLAVGTGTGHVLLYDLRADRPYVTKDQGYGLPIRSLAWTGNAAPSISGGGGGAARGRSEAEGKVMSADSKVIKVWDKDTVSDWCWLLLAALN